MVKTIIHLLSGWEYSLVYFQIYFVDSCLEMSLGASWWLAGCESYLCLRLKQFQAFLNLWCVQCSTLESSSSLNVFSNKFSCCCWFVHLMLQLLMYSKVILYEYNLWHMSHAHRLRSMQRRSICLFNGSSKGRPWCIIHASWVRRNITLLLETIVRWRSIKEWSNERTNKVMKWVGPMEMDERHEWTLSSTT